MVGRLLFRGLPLMLHLLKFLNAVMIPSNPGMN